MFGDLLWIGMQAITDARQLLCGTGVVTRADGGDQAIPPASCKHHFGDVWCQGDHTLGWCGKVNGSPGIVDQLYRLGLSLRQDGQAGPQHQTCHDKVNPAR